MKIISIVGARPNFMKIAPFIRAIENWNSSTDKKIDHLLVHTGQHYDSRMSESFFADLEISEPDINLGIGSGTHAEQVGKTMIEFEKVVRQERPDWIVVVGDVNATLACSVTAKKENVKLCHIEAGLRSGDLAMPEEINRLVTDRLSDLLLTPDKISSQNLRNEGVAEKRIVFTGNIMIDTLDSNLEKASKLDLQQILQDNLLKELNPMVRSGMSFQEFAVITLHRPSNVDNRDILNLIVRFFIDEASKELPLLWTLHPRTLKQLESYRLLKEIANCTEITLLHPLDYRSMLKLNMEAKLVITDSGGLQEESTVLGTPCITMRNNTERPVTLRDKGGLSVLVGNNISDIRNEFRKALTLDKHPVRPELWDGNTARRCVKAIMSYSG